MLIEVARWRLEFMRLARVAALVRGDRVVVRFGPSVHQLSLHAGHSPRRSSGTHYQPARGSGKWLRSLAIVGGQHFGEAHLRIREG